MQSPVSTVEIKLNKLENPSLSSQLNHINFRKVKLNNKRQCIEVLPLEY